MLTTDNFRIGALEQLQIYGRLMGVPTHSVRDAGELRRLLAELGSRKIVLIDTTGISQRDRHVAEQAAMLCDAGKTVRRLLVLNAASQGDTLDEVAHAYRNGVGEDVAGCIITKLDEASRLGAALDTAIRHRLPIHYMSVGQKVPEHLELARPDALIDRAFAMVERARALYTPSEADLASLWSSAKETPAVDPARRRQLLASAILRPQGGAAAVEAAQNLDDTLNWLDSDLACARARASWREYVSDGAGSSLSALADEPLAMARREFSAVCGRHLLVMHGKVGMKGDNLPGGTLLGSMLMSDRAPRWLRRRSSWRWPTACCPRSRRARPRSRIRPRRWRRACAGWAGSWARCRWCTCWRRAPRRSGRRSRNRACPGWLAVRAACA